MGKIATLKEGNDKLGLFTFVGKGDECPPKSTWATKTGIDTSKLSGYKDNQLVQLDDIEKKESLPIATIGEHIIGDKAYLAVFVKSQLYRPKVKLSINFQIIGSMLTTFGTIEANAQYGTMTETRGSDGLFNGITVKSVTPKDDGTYQFAQ